MITNEQYEQLHKAVDLDADISRRIGGKPNGWVVLDQDQQEQVERAMQSALGRGRATNAERSAVEVYEFNRDMPDKYFAYPNLDNRTVTTWTGETLGKIWSFGREWRSSFGDMRQSFSAYCNGVLYHGTIYGGMNLRMRRAKH